MFGKGEKFTRPVLVFHKFTSNSFLGLPITKQEKKGNWYVEITIHKLQFMRKRLKKKKRSCALCKPHKMRGDNRWKGKDLALLKIFEKEKNLWY